MFMPWVNTKRAFVPGNMVRSFKYLVFIALDPEGVKAEDGEPCYIVCVPDINCAITQGFGIEDAYEMGRDAASLLLDNIPEWRRPQPSPYNRARVKLEEFFNYIDGAENLDWSARWVSMNIPYKDPGPSKYCVVAEEKPEE